MSSILLFILGAFAGAIGAAVTLRLAGQPLAARLQEREAELAALKAEHDRVASDLKLLELATEGRAAAVKQENAELRRRMDALADEIMRAAERPSG